MILPTFVVPLPLKHSNENKHAGFNDLFGQDPHKKDLRIVSKTPAEVADQKSKDILVSAKVQAVIICGECLKPPCVYSSTKLSVNEQARLSSA